MLESHVVQMEDWSKRWCWVEHLERLEGVARERIFLYWKRLLKEAGIDWTKIGQLSVDRKMWKGRVREHMDHFRQWEWSTGHKWKEAAIECNMPKEVAVDVVFVCDV